MIIRKAMYGCGLYFFIKLAYNSPILCKFAPYLYRNKIVDNVQQNDAKLLLIKFE